MSRAQYEQQGAAEAWEEQITGYECPFCGTVYPKDRSDCDDGSDLVCCGEVGECVPYTLEMEQLQ